MQVVDISSNNHPNNAPINYAQVKQSGLVDGVVIKATQSLNYRNPWYPIDLAGFAQVGIPCLAYHYAGFNSPTTEAAYFTSYAGPLAAGLDIETSTDASWATDFLSALARPPSQRALYGSESTYPAGCPAIAWIAAYGPTAPSGADLWQNADNARVLGFPSPVDVSQWLASPAAFNLFFNIPAPQPTSEEAMVYGTVKWIVNGATVDLPAIFYPATGTGKPTILVQVTPPTPQCVFGEWQWADMTSNQVTVNGTPPLVAA